MELLFGEPEGPAEIGRRSALTREPDADHAVGGKGLLSFDSGGKDRRYFQNEYYHKCYCSICGYTVYRPHNWMINNSQTRYYCTICGATTSNPISPQKEMSVK